MAPQAVFFLPEGVFLAPQSRPGAGRRLGSVHEYVQAMLRRRPRRGAPLHGALGEAWTHAQHLQGLRFCLNELVPQLRSCGSASGSRREGTPPLLPQTFGRLERWASELLGGLDVELPPLESLEALDSLLKVPSMLLGGMLIPISPVAPTRSPGSPIVAGGTCYVRRAGDARPFEEVLREVRRELERCLHRQVRVHRALTRMASLFLGEVKSVLERCDPEDCGGYQLFYRDEDHQLQHSRGHWILVRGPVTTRVDGRAVFAGLHLAGHGRRDWLSVPTRAGADPGGFWGPDGAPLRGGICMGHPGQYLWLFSDAYTDAEAVIEWLDAGVILVSGRSEFHRHLRASRAGTLPGRQVDIRQRLAG